MPFPSPGDLLDTGIEPRFPALQADSFPSEPPGKPLRRNDKDVIKKNDAMNLRCKGQISLITEVFPSKFQAPDCFSPGSSRMPGAVDT